MRIFITGSTDGLGQMTARRLINEGHEVVLHARNEERGDRVFSKMPGAEKIVTGDLSSIGETKALAAQVNELGKFDTVIHNAGVYQVAGKLIFAVNSLAPYILTCLINRPKRLIYLSSGMHMHGEPKLENLTRDTGRISYSDSKLHVQMLSIAVARKWPAVFSNTVDPGWVPTKMGGPGAPDNLEKGFDTQAWLAVSNDNKAKVSGRYFHHKVETRYHPKAASVALQEQFLALCEQITDVHFPADKGE
ncbi:MAG TPA: SDR family NAD(P)-dependent oxidoreductase [Flavitalea sp.]|nr:SDR family NAD(P)-dependent oxidoreductase [Flavitalea sp.]